VGVLGEKLSSEKPPDLRRLRPGVFGSSSTPFGLPYASPRWLQLVDIRHFGFFPLHIGAGVSAVRPRGGSLIRAWQCPRRKCRWFGEAAASERQGEALLSPAWQRTGAPVTFLRLGRSAKVVGSFHRKRAVGAWLGKKFWPGWSGPSSAAAVDTLVSCPE